MKQKLTHSTLLMSLAGRIEQEQLKIGTGSGSSVGIYFDIGSEGKPGIRYVKASGWEYSLDGITWLPIGGGGDLTYEPIEFTKDDLSIGILTIAHNLNNQYPLGIGYSVEPKRIIFKDANTLEFDYSDQPTGGGVDSSVIVVATSTSTSINGEYHLVDGMDLSAPESLPTSVAIWKLTDTIWFELAMLVAGRYSWKLRANGNLALETGSFLSADGWKWPWDTSLTWSGSVSPIPTVTAKESVGFAGGTVWFVHSKQDMLMAPAPSTAANLVVTGAGTSTINGTYNMHANVEGKTLAELSTTTSLLCWVYEDGSTGGTGIALNKSATAEQVQWSMIRYGTGYYHSEFMDGLSPTKWPWECGWTVSASATGPAPTVTKQ